MAGERTHYQVLDVSPTATREQVRDQYRRLVRLLHPDRYAAASEAERGLAERRMREVTEAWSVIGDAAARSRYDEELARLDALRRASARRAAHATSPAASRTPPAPGGSAGHAHGARGGVGTEVRDADARPTAPAGA
jgi:curved DNA-binding protein CbpA